MIARKRARGTARWRFAVVVAIALCLQATGAGAQYWQDDPVRTWSVAAAVGYAIPNTDEFEGSLTGRLVAGYRPYPQLEVDLEFGWFASDISQPEKDGLPSHDIASGEIGVLPVCLTLQYRAEVPQTNATFILLVGGGYYFINYTMDDAARAVFAASGTEGLPDQVVDSAPGLHAGVGLEFALSDLFSVTVEGRYLFVAPRVDGTASQGNRIGGSLDLNTWLITSGIKVAF